VLSLASLSIFNSVLARRSRDAIVVSYLAVIAYVGLSLLSRLLLVSQLGIADFPSTESPVTVRDVVEWLGAGNPAIAVYHLFNGGSPGGMAPDEVLPALLRNYAIFHLLAAGICSAWAVARLRAVALRQTYGKTQRASLASALRIRPRVGTSPMVWKEVFVESGYRLSWFGWIVVAVLVLASLSPTVFIGIEFFNSYWGGSSYHYRDAWDMLAESMNGAQVRFVGTMVASFLLLSVAVRAAGSISGERERRTLGSLLTTPLDSNSILFGKWLGSMLSVRWALIWLGLIWLLGLLTRGLHVLALPGLIAAWTVYAAFLATLGLWFSTICRTTLRAVLSTVFSAVGLAFGHWLIWACCIPLSISQPGTVREFDWLWKIQFGITPPLALAWLAFYGPEFEDRHFSHDSTSLEVTIFSLLGIVLWALATGGLWAVTCYRLRQVTGRTALRHPERPGRFPLRRSPAPNVLDLLPVTAPTPVPTEPTGAILVEEEWSDPETSAPGGRGAARGPENQPTNLSPNDDPKHEPRP
jgi:ABC-type transport system involved in multi-copper enzyme maturation permease subunit